MMSTLKGYLKHLYFADFQYIKFGRRGSKDLKKLQMPLLNGTNSIVLFVGRCGSIFEYSNIVKLHHIFEYSNFIHIHWGL